MFERMRAWSERNMPTRETFERIGWLRPIAHRILLPELWRFHRRSVPRGVALGVLVGVLIPVAQTVFAAIFALPSRANVPVAALTTFITNPFTTPAIWAFSIWIGRMMLGHHGGDPAVVEGVNKAMGWSEWLLRDVGPALGLGLVVVAVVGAVLGYLVASITWRMWIAHKWRHRRHERQRND
ncbi:MULTISPECIES: DUF2062 domain-containing protein [Sphingomonadales]|uniref:DUF2062 domain-containing protein n=2 Tax=Edaphosphingomonas TaxID=3423724 RepID=A0A2T4HMW9_9SPHN|nr:MULTISPECIES: DUF2062 domain-containing protein [Sphingomonas]AGH51325.1 hypothetical protein G432_18035 [Sphingomonas sp. MM-1]PTD17117.1 DUF2062 domain-containing protein [Sphingomonas fennica]